MPQKIGLFLFRNDLRLHDNAALIAAAKEVDQLICLYCHETTQPPSRLIAPSHLSPHRKAFLAQALTDLQASLKALGQHLMISPEPAAMAIPQLITLQNIDAIRL